jgi:hypothetical protein
VKELRSFAENIIPLLSWEAIKKINYIHVSYVTKKKQNFNFSKD